MFFKKTRERWGREAEKVKQAEKQRILDKERKIRPISDFESIEEIIGHIQDHPVQQSHYFVNVDDHPYNYKTNIYQADRIYIDALIEHIRGMKDETEIK